jgi:fused signal recognition particle receptor
MGRWFRRKGQDRGKPREEGKAPPPHELELPPEAPPEISPPPAEAPEPAAVAAGEPEAAEAIPESSEQVVAGVAATGPESTPAGPLEPRGPEEMAAPAELPEAEAGEATATGRHGLFQRLRARLSRTREALGGGLDRLLRGRKVVDAALLEELEELLITADLGVETTLFLVQALQEKLRRRELGDVERLKAALKAEMVALLKAPPPREITSRPWVTLLVGVNGVGKTTTIAKLAHRDHRQGLTPLLVAADTFRAAAVEQLEIWGQRVGAPVVKQKTGADPAAVVFDGLTAALARGLDTVYLDTAGRLHTKVNLMEELKKINRTAEKKIPGAPHEVLLILDATTGQNALSQARLFHEAVGLTGIIITKMDGTAKGGVVLAIAHETGIPLRYLGVGEGLEDLRPFDAGAFVDAILE